MKAVDTNVLVRYLTADDPAQASAASRIFEGDRVFISKSVLLETEWVLRGAYRRSPREIAGVFAALADAKEIEIEDERTVRRAIAWFAQGLDFADALHVASRRQDVEFLTFDKGLVSISRRAGIEGVRRITP